MSGEQARQNADPRDVSVVVPGVEQRHVHDTLIIDVFSPTSEKTGIDRS